MWLEVKRVLDSGSKGLGFDSKWWSRIEVSGTLCIQTVSVHAAIMGT